MAKDNKKKGGAYKFPEKFCPKCGVRMAGHADRLSCGKCGYTEWKKNELKQAA